MSLYAATRSVELTWLRTLAMSASLQHDGAWLPLQEELLFVQLFACFSSRRSHGTRHTTVIIANLDTWPCKTLSDSNVHSFGEDLTV